MSTPHRRSKFQQVPIKEKLQFRWIRLWFHHRDFRAGRRPHKVRLCECLVLAFCMQQGNTGPTLSNLFCSTLLFDDKYCKPRTQFEKPSVATAKPVFASMFSSVPQSPEKASGCAFCIFLWQIRISTVRVHGSVSQVPRFGGSKLGLESQYGDWPVGRDKRNHLFVLLGSPILTVLRPPHIGLFNRTVFTLISSYFILFHLISS